MDRRGFISWTGRAAVAAGWAGVGKTLWDFSSQGSAPAAALFLGANTPGAKLIIPTDAPDRFRLKVMEFNPIPALDAARWELEVGGLVGEAARLKLSDLKRLPAIDQSSRLKCVQCWSARVLWHGFRGADLFRLVRPQPRATWIRVDCADLYYDYFKMEELLHPRTLFALGLNGAALTPEHGAPLRLVLPFKYGYKYSKLITKITFIDHGGQGVVADTWPYYSLTGDIEPGIDHPFDFPGAAKNIKGGEITDY